MSTLISEAIQVTSVAASICAETGARIDTFQLRYPRMVHADFMTHRVFSRNASSSRAIPVKSLIARDANYYVPNFRKNKPGMQPGGAMSPEKQAAAEAVWSRMAAVCAEGALELSELGVAKQWANRPLEWFGYIDVVVTATDWKNFFGLRDHPDAQDEIEILARRVSDVQAAASPLTLAPGQWHLPYIRPEDREYISWACRTNSGPLVDQLKRLLFAFDHPLLRYLTWDEIGMIAVSVARCCRVSYSKHDGSASTIEEDVDLFLRLAGAQPIHASPLEHQATPASGLLKNELTAYTGNLNGWCQYRKLVPGETI